MGKREFDNALAASGLEKDVEITYHAYELRPNGLKEPTLTTMEEYAQKTNKPIASVKESFASITERARRLGLAFNWDNMLAQDTHKAHSIAMYAAEKGKGREFQERAFHAIFTDNLFLVDTEVLVQLARDIGLDEKEVRAVAENPHAYANQFKRDRELAITHGLRGVPHFLIHDTTIRGAQPQIVLEEVLKKAATKAGIV